MTRRHLRLLVFSLFAVLMMGNLVWSWWRLWRRAEEREIQMEEIRELREEIRQYKVDLSK